MNKLDDLMFKYRADKSSKIKHHYCDVYANLIQDRHQAKKILEIGTAEGASLFAWRDYYPNAFIFGGEVEQKRVDMMKDQKRIRVYKCDQFNVDDLHNLLNNTGTDLDLVIDDGSHIVEHQLFTCEHVVPLLNKGSIYVIEDVDGKHAQEMYEELNRFFPNYIVQMVEVGLRHDDRMIIIKK